MARCAPPKPILGLIPQLTPVVSFGIAASRWRRHPGGRVLDVVIAASRRGSQAGSGGAGGNPRPQRGKAARRVLAS